MEQAKQAMLAENMDFSEQSEPSQRSGAGYPSLGGYIETHYDFAQASPDLKSLQKQLKAAITARDSGRKNSNQQRINMLRGKITDKLKLDKIAKEEAFRRESDMNVYTDPRGKDSDYAEEGDTQDFGRCQRPDGSYYGSRGRCIKGSDAGAKQEEPKKTRAKKSGGGGSGAEAKGGGGGAMSKADSFDLRSTMKGNSGSSEKEKAAAEKELRRRIAEHEKKGYKKSDAIDSAKKTLAKYEQYDKEGGRKTSEGTRQAVGKLEYALDQAT